METYRLNTEDIERTRSKQIRVWMFATAFYFVGTLFTSLIWPARHPSESLVFEVLSCAIGACFWGGMMFIVTCRPWRDPDFAITVDKDAVTTNTFAHRVVRFNSIQTVIERKANAFRGGGLFVSEQTRAAAYLWARGVWIPCEMPQYEMLKRAIELRRSPLLEAEASSQS